MVLSKIKNKKGVTMVFALWIFIFAVLFTAFLIDVGMSFYVRTHFQTIADAASIAGAIYAGEAYNSPYDGRALVRIDPSIATSKATQVIRENERFLPPRARVRIDRVTYNPEGEVINGVAMRRVDQYYASRDAINPEAHFTVRMWGRYFTQFFGDNFFGNVFAVDLSADARTTVGLDR